MPGLLRSMSSVSCGSREAAVSLQRAGATCRHRASQAKPAAQTKCCRLAWRRMGAFKLEAPHDPDQTVQVIRCRSARGRLADVSGAEMTPFANPVVKIRTG